MRARDIVGRKVVAIRQTRFLDRTTDTWKTVIDALVLDNGKSLVLMASETEQEPIVEGWVQ